MNTEADMSIYASAKAAMNHLAANLAYDFDLYGVRINCSGSRATETRSLASVMTPQRGKKMLHHTPYKKTLGMFPTSPKQYFSLFSASSWINGQVLSSTAGENRH